MLDVIIGLLADHGEEIAEAIGGIALAIGGFFVVKEGVKWLKAHGGLYKVVKDWLAVHNKNRTVVKIVAIVSQAVSVSQRTVKLFAEDRNKNEKIITERVLSVEETKGLKEGKKNVLASDNEVLEMMNS